MSRRRGRRRAEPVDPTRPDGRRKPLFRADMVATARVEDPAGHLLVRFGRDLSEPDPSRIWYHRGTIRATVTMRADPSWALLEFECLTCRESGQAWRTRIDYTEVAEAVTAAWEDGSPCNTPARRRVTTQPA